MKLIDLLFAHGATLQHNGHGPAAQPAGVAQQLLERADDLAARQPHEARQLRAAAHAFLRVVR